MVFVLGIVITLLILVAATWPIVSMLSGFEIQRRLKLEGDVRIEALRAEVYSELMSLKRVIEALLLVLVVPTMITTFGWVVGISVSVVLALGYGNVARIPYVRRAAAWLYVRYELALLEFISRHKKLFHILASFVPQTDTARIASREELAHEIEHGTSGLTRDEKLLLLHAMKFRDITVESVMTPRSVMNTVKASEMVGPLVLDELHKTGHSRFPVVGEDIDHIVGMLYIQDLLALRTKDSHMASTIMNKSVYFIHQEQTLEHALAAFLKTRHHLFVVVNKYRETVGLLSLEDVMESLIGRPIIDEFDRHDDLRAVAARNPRGNNSSSSSHTVD